MLFEKQKILKVFLANRPITFMTLRAVSWEVKQVLKMVFKFSRVAWLNLKFYWSLCKETWEAFVFKKCCDWIIFFQVPWFEYSHQDIRELKQRWRGRQRKRQKSNRFDQQNNNFACASHFFWTFLCRRCPTTTWKCLNSRFVKDGNTRQQLSFLFLNFDTVL